LSQKAGRRRRGRKDFSPRDLENPSILIGFDLKVGDPSGQKLPVVGASTIERESQFEVNRFVFFQVIEFFVEQISQISSVLQVRSSQEDRSHFPFFT
jgi:hypothetical protein